MVDRHSCSWGLLHRKRLLLKFCWVSTSKICWIKGYIVDYQVTFFMPMKEMNSSSWWPHGDEGSQMQYFEFSCILQCTYNAFILPLICSHQCAMICFTSKESTLTSRWAQTAEQQLRACFSFLPSAMIAGKAKEPGTTSREIWRLSDLWERSCFFHFPSREESLNQIVLIKRRLFWNRLGDPSQY